MPPRLVLVIGLIAASSSVIFIKESRFDPVILAAGRLWVAAACVLPWFLSAARAHPGFLRANLRRVFWPSVLLAVHFITWIIGARLTPAVNSSLLVNMIPVVTPILLLVMAHERLTHKEILATLVALSGAVVLGAWDFQFKAEYFVGDLICFGSMVLFASYLVLGRVNRDFPALWLYMTPLYFFAGLSCAVVASITADFDRQPRDPYQVALLVGLGVVPTIIGHGCLNHALKHIRGQVVGVANLGQVVSAGILAYFILGEVPEPNFYPASALIAGAIAWAMFSARASTRS